MLKTKYSEIDKVHEGFHTGWNSNPLYKQPDGTYSETTGTTDETQVYSSSSGAQDDLKTQQLRIKEITETELLRFQQLEADRAKDLDRMDLIRRTEHAKRGKYTWLLAIFVMVCIVGFGFLYIQNVLKYKSIWFDIIVVILVASLLITAIVVSLDIQDRDPNDFSKLKPNSDKLINMTEINASASSGSNISGTDLGRLGCIGPDCCGSGTVWSEANNRCE